MEDISNCEIEFDEPTRKRMDTFLRKLGANDRFIDSVKQRVTDVDVQNAVSRFRTFAQENPAVILGALSAVVLGGGVIAAGKAMKSSRQTSRKRSTTSKKTRSASSKRTLIEPHAGDKRYVRRDARGRRGWSPAPPTCAPGPRAARGRSHRSRPVRRDSDRGATRKPHSRSQAVARGGAVQAPAATLHRGPAAGPRI